MFPVPLHAANNISARGAQVPANSLSNTAVVRPWLLTAE